MQLQAKSAEGFTVVVKRKCGTERDGGSRNLFYQLMLKKPV